MIIIIIVKIPYSKGKRGMQLTQPKILQMQ